MTRWKSFGDSGFTKTKGIGRGGSSNGSNNNGDGKADIDVVREYMIKLEQTKNFPANKKMYYKSRGIEVPTENLWIYEDYMTRHGNNCDMKEEDTALIRTEKEVILNRHKTEVFVERNKKIDWNRRNVFGSKYF